MENKIKISDVVTGFKNSEKIDIQRLRRKTDAVVSNQKKELIYDIQETHIVEAQKHLETLYTGRVNYRFAADMLKLYAIHCV